MSVASESEQTPLDSSLDAALSDLAHGGQRLKALSLTDRCDLLDDCAQGVVRNAEGWVKAACDAKRISIDKAIAGEEILAGPCGLMRYLRLMSRVLRDVARTGSPRLPSKPRTNSVGRQCVPIMPANHLYDALIFKGMQAAVWQQATAGESLVFNSAWLPQHDLPPRIAGVLGAGNVSAIPATDALHKIFVEHETVLLKLNPVNEYLEPYFVDAFAPLIAADLLRIVRGDHETGTAMVQHPRIDTLHLTGSHLTHDAIVWGTDPEDRARRQRENRPLVTKTITSELGNVTPWVIVPGQYTQRQLKSQAEHVVASIVNNASYNCVATKMIVTSRQWQQRETFLDLVDSLLQRVAARDAYYPGSHERFERAAGFACNRDDGTLPWTLIRDAKSDRTPHLFNEESFVCVCAETQLDSSSPEAFLSAAVDFVNETLFGTLCVTLTVPDEFRKQNPKLLEQAIDRLRYGSVCVNQWSGIVYGLMTPPWGGHHTANIQSPQSGIGHVHNTFGIANVDKTVLRGPLCSTPKPVWFPTHRTADRVGRSLMHFYEKTSLLRLPPVFYHALKG